MMRSAVEEEDVSLQCDRWSGPGQSRCSGRALTSLSVEAGDVGGRLLVVGGQAFVVLGSLAVLLASLSPSGSAPHKDARE